MFKTHQQKPIIGKIFFFFLNCIQDLMMEQRKKVTERKCASVPYFCVVHVLLAVQRGGGEGWGESLLVNCIEYCI